MFRKPKTLFFKSVLAFSTFRHQKTLLFNDCLAFPVPTARKTLCVQCFTCFLCFLTHTHTHTHTHTLTAASVSGKGGVSGKQLWKHKKHVKHWTSKVFLALGTRKARNTLKNKVCWCLEVEKARKTFEESCFRFPKHQKRNRLNYFLVLSISKFQHPLFPQCFFCFSSLQR